ncbi:RRQRL motif-containing zinc-binding protein [Actinokineospora globicatena]|uniref:Uncharacterized protein n=1 Tax=Actinokineospora globicatena TaxID=103729 RepID=A0A9W6QVQ8_9PSEU|nr:RRQRL motif-containing zinc-binding protein [Actinokineospora globicatena]GLW95437.1 hypothetical protein Aglo03_62530 [Actinokineospora globicatena]
MNTVRLPWNGQHWPGLVRDGVPTFRYRDAPRGLATRRQLRGMGLCPGGHEAVAQIKWRRGRRRADLYLVDTASVSPGATTAQLAALWKANRVLRTCTECGVVKTYRMPTFTGRRCWDCDQKRGAA